MSEINGPWSFMASVVIAAWLIFGLVRLGEFLADRKKQKLKYDRRDVR